MTARPVLAVLAALGLALSACGGDAELPGGMTALTVAGAIGAPDRGPMDPQIDRYFAWAGLDFERGRRFARADLAALPQHRLQIVSDAAPAGAYEGPLLADVLDLAQADGDTLIAHALDGYAAAVPLRRARTDGAILAIARDGAPLALGADGPVYIVFPDSAGADPGWYVWGLILISVE